mmetsp:Transcript_100595/g.288266  ORF Transcript_100595/g.288266 Transcript_100595/m.288266 type:complete len:320 (+) Transcript_100595:814-1773(+)
MGVLVELVEAALVAVFEDRLWAQPELAEARGTRRVGVLGTLPNGHRLAVHQKLPQPARARGVVPVVVDDADHARVQLHAAPHVVPARWSTDGHLAAGGVVDGTTEVVPHVDRVDRGQAGLLGNEVGRVLACEPCEGRVPVPEGDETVELLAVHGGRDEPARSPRVHADAALPVCRLAALERPVVRAGRAVAVDGPAVVRAEDDQRVVPHAASLDRVGHVTDRAVEEVDHGVVPLPVIVVVVVRHEVELRQPILGHLQRLVDDVRRVEEEERVLRLREVVVVHDLERARLEEGVLVHAVALDVILRKRAIFRVAAVDRVV